MASNEKDILDKGAILQRDRKTYAITPRIPCGWITDFSLLKRIAEVAERYGAEGVKVTSSQRLAIIGVRAEDLDSIFDELDMDPGRALGPVVHNVKACPGSCYCRLGQQGSMELGLTLEEKLAGRPTPAKAKVAVSGCPMDCAGAHLRDVGVIGTRNGFTVEVGGRGGGKPKIGQPVAKGLTAEEAEALVTAIMDAYCQTTRKTRLGRLLEKMGVEAFMEKVMGAVKS